MSEPFALESAPESAPVSASPISSTPEFLGLHHDFLKSRVPAWFTQATPGRQQELAEQPLQLPDWYVQSAAPARRRLSASHRQWRERLNTLEAQLGTLEDIATFAEPLLKAEILRQFKLDLDVKQVYFARKYRFTDQPFLGGAFAVDTSGSTLNDFYRGVSLLEAALANFESHEEVPLACSDCHIITRYGAYDDDVIAPFSVLAEHAVPIAPHAFARLCRTLDLGALYQAHLTERLRPADSVKRVALEQTIEAHTRELLAMHIDIARLQNTLSRDAALMLQQVLAGDAKASLDGQPVRVSALQVLDTVLAGPLVFGPARDFSGRIERVVVFLPHDPQQPLKEYASASDFMADLRARLHVAAYRRFFSRYIQASDHGAFFGRFNARYRPDGVAANADFARSAAPPTLSITELPIRGDLWPLLRVNQVDKIFADAQTLAVPTAKADSDERAKRLEAYWEAVVSVLNLAAFVVPGLGPLMLVVGAAQMVEEVVEGVDAFEKDQQEAMWTHFSSVALNVAFIGAGAVVLPGIQWNPTLDSLKRVTLPSGEERLWKPDLQDYALKDWQPQTQPDEHGLYTQNGDRVLALDGHHYRVAPDPSGEYYRIQHPSRPEAYQPRVRQNGFGAWLHEADQPLTWAGAPLMRRLGGELSGFSDDELLRIQRASGIDDDQLRRVHANQEPTPAVLIDTARQWRAYADSVEVGEQIGRGKLSDALCGYAAALMTELPGWPVGKAIEIIEGTQAAPVRYGEALAQDGVLSIDRRALLNGELPARVVESLGAEALKGLLGSSLAPDNALRTQALTQRLQAYARQHQGRLFRSIYSDRMPPDNPAIRLVQRDFKRLPTVMVKALLENASPAERSALTTRQRVPLRLAEQARKLQAQLRLVHAYEGLYLPALDNPDTETLALNSLENLPGWHDDLRLEVHDERFGGRLRAAFGPEGASERKVLVRVADGRYQAFDQQGQQLHGINGFFGALQHALTDTHRTAIGLPHVGQGEQLERLVIDKALPRDALRGVLRMPLEQLPAWRLPHRLSGKRLGYPLSGRGQGRAGNIHDRVRALYPTMTDEQLNGYLALFSATDDAWLRALELEFQRLDSALNRWMGGGPRDPQSLRVRRRIRDALRLAWQKGGEWDVDTNNDYRGQRIHFEDPEVGPQLATLPLLPGNFDHVTSLHLPGCGVTDQSNPFLLTFRALRILNLEGNDLTRLPDVCANGRRLEGLDLSDNQIVLSEESALLVRHMRRLSWLALQGNPLGRGVDLTLMPRLNWLYLGGCDLTEWPTGLFAAPRPRDFVLDLSGNHLTAIPDVALGSDRARLLSRSTVTREWLPPEVLERLKLYIESIGLDPDRRFPPRGTQDSAHWMSGMSERQWLSRQPLWNDLEEAPNSESFFDEIRKLGENLGRRDEAYRIDLTRKVWRMLDAMGSDEVLRERLFQMALAPTTCVDAAAQLFNAMGVEVLLHEALALTDPALMRLELLDLATGKARLDELGRIARARVAELHAQGRPFPLYDEEGALVQQTDDAGNPLPSIDEVEIYLAYVSALANRLDLPWQTTMFFDEPDVTPAMIEDAYTRVRALEDGDLMREGLIDQPFWREYVQATFASEFEGNSARIEALLDLQVAQQEWADNGALSTEHKAELRGTIDTAAQLLGMLPAEVMPGQVMGAAEYSVRSQALAEQRRDILRRLTDQVTGRVAPAPEAQLA